MSILARIADVKREEVARLKRERGLASLKEGARSRKPPKDFLPAVNRADRLSLIGEIKKASPSRGVLRGDFDVKALAGAYARGGANALSVLTDRDHFQGSLAYLHEAAQASGLPVLRKDFLIDEIQVYEAREAGADAVLLITALMPPARLKELLATVAETGMAALVEIHDERELEAALAAGASFLGINNRNLADFTVDLGTSFSLLAKCPKGVPVVSESGIFTREDAGKLRKAGACAILVGEAFMVRPDVEAAVKALLPES